MTSLGVMVVSAKSIKSLIFAKCLRHFLFRSEPEMRMNKSEFRATVSKLLGIKVEVKGGGFSIGEPCSKS
jgi:hypothetical protein